MSVPWPIIGVESRGGTVVRIRHADSTIADHDFSYLLGGAGVFAHLTDEMIPEAGICDGGTVGWETSAGVIDLAPDALVGTRRARVLPRWRLPRLDAGAHGTGEPRR